LKAKKKLKNLKKFEISKKSENSPGKIFLTSNYSPTPINKFTTIGDEILENVEKSENLEKLKIDKMRQQ
jgi:hypothetical protein